MRSRKKLWLGLALAWTVATLGCSKPTSVSVALNISSATIIIGQQVQFTATVTGSTNTSVNWTVNGVAGGNATVGLIGATTGLYTAPAVVPSPVNVTVAATSQADSSASASATVTISSGITVTISPSSATLGTNETSPFFATVTGTTTANCAALNLTPAQCTAVTWEVCSAFTAATATAAATCTSSSSVGTIASTTGLYTAPSSIPSASVIIVATSVADKTVTGTGGVEIINAVDPTVSAVSPSTAPQGGLFQDIYLTGTHFISTTSVLLSISTPNLQLTNVPVATPCTEGNTNTSTGCFSLPNGSVVSQGSSSTLSIESTTMRVRLPDFMLAGQPALPNTSYPISVSVVRQNGVPQTCPTQSQCQVTVTPVRPAIVGPSPDSTPQGGGSALNFNINGGYYGTSANPTVTALYNGQVRSASITSSTRQIGVTIGGSLNGSDFSTPGLYPVTLQNNTQQQYVASTNLAVRPAYGPPATTQSTLGAPTTLTVGTQPSAVAINRATGIAVVANQSSNDVTLIDMTQNPPKVVVPSICTETVGDTGPCGAADASSPKTGPTGVAVDYVLNVALVANNASNSISEIDLAQHKVIAIIPTAQNPYEPSQQPYSVGTNSTTGQGIVVYQSTNSAGLICLTASACPYTQSAVPPITLPAITGIVTASTGPAAQVEVEPHSNWAVITPGGLGTLTLADLGRQTQDIIVSVTRTSGTVTITTSAGGTVNPGLPSTPTGLQVNQPVLITGMPDSSLNGTFTVASIVSANSYTFTQSAQSKSQTPPKDTSCSLNTSNPPRLVCTGFPAATANIYDNYSSPIATLSVPISITGIAINSETQKAILTDPTNTGASVYVFNLLDQTSSAFGVSPLGYSAAAFNPLTNTALVLNSTQSTSALIDPTIPAPVPLSTSLPSGNKPVAADIDPGTNQAIIVNQADGTATIYSLGAVRPLQITDVSPNVFTIATSLTAPANPSDQTLTIVGKGFTGSSTARLNGISLSTLSVSDREMMVQVPRSMISSPSILSLELFNSPNFSNSEDVNVIETVDVTGGGCTQPAPAGVAFDPQNNLIVASLSGCNTLAIINLTTGTGQTVSVGSFPTGVAVMPSLHLAAVANEGSSNVSIVDTLAASVTQTESTSSGPVGVAMDQNTQEVAVACSTAGVINLFNAVTPGSVASIAVDQFPVSVAIDPLDNLVASANAEGNDVAIVDELGSSATVEITGLEEPTNVVYDPSADEFLVSSSLSNQFYVIKALTNQG
ncbi:MAG: hypothetical protein ACLP1Y_11395, partial [Candidatus Acidiferrales bacterium]